MCIVLRCGAAPHPNPPLFPIRETGGGNVLSPSLVFRMGDGGRLGRGSPRPAAGLGPWGALKLLTLCSSRRSTTRRTRTRRTSEAMIVKSYASRHQLIEVKIENARRFSGLSLRFDFQHLVEVAVVEFTFPTDADEVATHDACGCYRIERS